MAVFGWVFGILESIFSSSSKNGGFLLGVAFLVFFSSSLYRRYTFTRVRRRVLQASPSRSSYPQAIKQFPISFHTGFFLVYDYRILAGRFPPHFSSNSVVSWSSTFVFCSRHFQQFSFAQKLNYLLQAVYLDVLNMFRSRQLLVF